MLERFTDQARRVVVLAEEEARILDHNWNLWGRATCELEDPDVNRYVEGIAWHVYGGKDTAMSQVHESYPNKHAYVTECSPDYKDPAYMTGWATWAEQFAGMFRSSRQALRLAADQSVRPCSAISRAAVWAMRTR